MRKRLPKILVTGGCGFIGSAFVRLAANKGYQIVVVDKLTYAGDINRIKGSKYKLYKVDICDQKKIERIFLKEKPKVVVHFAAETHVDRSILDARPFIQANIIGTQVLVDAARKFKVNRFVHISTDEIYGEIKKGKFKEPSPLIPSNPYSATKAAADALIQSYVRTYKLPAVIVRPSNNYGLWQYPEKLIPVAVYKALHNQKIPVYAKGQNTREWLFVEDCAKGVLTVMKKGKIGEIYNLGSAQESKNIETVKKIIKELKKKDNIIKFVKDRPGHDFRYALDFSKLKKLGWKPKIKFSQGIKKTVYWYKDNQAWLDKKVSYLKDYWKKVYKNK